MDKNSLSPYLDTTLESLALPVDCTYPVYKGKVRDIVDLGKNMVITTSDRISAFDRVLSTIPCKGQVLNELSLFWFEQTNDIIGNHILKKISPRTVAGRKCSVLPIEVVVRGYLTGSAWRDYQQGKAISGIVLPPNLKSNHKFDTPLFTPSTKEEKGKHDLPISSDEIINQGIVKKALLEKIESTALKLFQRGTEIAARNGLILVDTKYEFGLLGDDLYLVDEVHTPDSSRYWYADTYAALYEKGEKQRELDKEYLRQWLIGQDFMGDGNAPEIPDDIRLEVALRYITAYETITGQTFVPSKVNAAEELKLVTSAMEAYK
ncbi:MAG: phosphoribosylaminoimidazolesuccinocarboxamide synthase [Spirochaetales bacterium]|nr:phosphoribosylaminoimidazolesuccinocarboxamide synthase [Spirochaetales bacterium]